MRGTVSCSILFVGDLTPFAVSMRFWRRQLKWPNRNYSDASVERGLAKGGRYQKMTTYLYLASRVKDGINLQSTSSLQGYRLRSYDTRTYFASLPSVSAVASAASTSSTRNSN